VGFDEKHNAMQRLFLFFALLAAPALGQDSVMVKKPRQGMQIMPQRRGNGTAMPMPNQKVRRPALRPRVNDRAPLPPDSSRGTSKLDTL
jgi:hypothetical protein